MEDDVGISVWLYRDALSADGGWTGIITVHGYNRVMLLQLCQPIYSKQVNLALFNTASTIPSGEHWPREVGEEIVYGGLRVRLTREDSCGDIVERKMEVIAVDHSKSSSKLTV